MANKQSHLSKSVLAMQKANTTHGMRHTRFYMIYRNMLSRCYNKHVKKYDIYGARGIKCDWPSFEKFFKDMYPSYGEHVKSFGEKNTSIDRIDPNGNYNKENCKWSTWKEQATNRRNTIYVQHDGKRMSLVEAAELLGKTYNQAYWHFGISKARDALKDLRRD